MGENYTEHPQIFTYWTIREPHATLGDGDLQTPEVDWLAGLPYDWISFAPADDQTRKKAKEKLSETDFARYSATEKLQTETFILWAFLCI